ncbi:molybdenum cofactor guanylyltransferase [Striga asiatica]|uniref:Molybdenum cofactor guanylyltransferase n=1 Tax=Striga asiatica TaxID=4170 RepID=A0A5A7PBV0_STRAF|nr:molybdenum cofactor guanylyltransferase [Striga asiatica]
MGKHGKEKEKARYSIWDVIFYAKQVKMIVYLSKHLLGRPVSCERPANKSHPPAFIGGGIDERFVSSRVLGDSAMFPSFSAAISKALTTLKHRFKYYLNLRTVVIWQEKNCFGASGSIISPDISYHFFVPH